MRHRRTAVGLGLATLAFSVAGCVAKANHRANADGGYTLQAEVRTMEQAITRFRGSAEELCGAAYVMTPPVATKGAWRYTADGVRAAGGTVTLRSELTCR